jgi:hypothetical protein
MLALLLALSAVPALAQSPQPSPPPQQPVPQQPPPPQEQPPRQQQPRWFFGGGVGAGFGSVDYVTISPLIGMRAAPRLLLGLQPFYRWTRDSLYSPTVTTNDYGAALWVRVPIVKGLFAEADYQYTSYEYPTGFGGTTRGSYNAFLAGGGYSVPAGRNVSVYFSALYDFSYDGNDPHRLYDSPVVVSAGVSVGF